MRGPLRVLLLLCAVFVVLATPARADAYTWMIRHQYSGCGVCHADPSGGEVLTPYGRAQSDLLLRMRWDGKKAEEAEPSSAAGFLGLMELPDPVMLGGSLRMATTLKDGDIRPFPMQMDLYGQFRVGSFFAGGSAGLSKVAVGSPHARSAQITRGQGNEFNAISRNHYLGMDFAEGALTARLGRLNLPFGIRIPEHTMWVREATRTDRESDQQHGVALAYGSEQLRAEGMVILGNYQVNPDMFRERGYAFFVELMVATRSAFGVSSLYTLAKRDRLTLETNVARGAHGAFGRVTVFDPLALLLEANLINDSSRTLGYVGFAQADFEIMQGLHAIVTGEVLNLGQSVKDKYDGVPTIKGAGKPALGGWLSAAWFFLPHLDMRIDATFRPGGMVLLSQLHAFL
jgi:hypothetical protein